MIFYRLNRIDRASKTAWTSISDVGREFGDTVFTLSDYLDCENNFITIVENVMQCLNVTDMIVKKFNLISANIPDFIKHGNTLPIGASLSASMIHSVIQSALREESWCFLVADNQLWITVGDDYHIHIAASKPLDRIVTIAGNLGLSLLQVDWLEDGMREQFEN